MLRPAIEHLRLHIIIKGVFLVDLFRKALDSSRSLREGRCFTSLYISPLEVAAQAILLGMSSAHLLGIWRWHIQSIREVVGGESLSWVVNLASTANHFTIDSWRLDACAHSLITLIAQWAHQRAGGVRFGDGGGYALFLTLALIILVMGLIMAVAGWCVSR